VAVAVPFVACFLDVADAFGHRGEFGAGYSGQGGIGEQLG
jgi:hypothetical protein